MSKELQNQSVLDKQFALRLSVMIDSNLICYKHYYNWADEIILSMDKPSYWVVELAVTRDSSEAVAVVGAFVHSEPFEKIDWDQYNDEYIACLFLQYEQEKLSWETFLREAGANSDANSGLHDCEYFYCFLDGLEQNKNSKSIEVVQKAEFEKEFSKALDSIRALYDGFLPYFKAYIADEVHSNQS